MQKKTIMRNNRTNGHIFLTIVLGLACMITSCERSTSTGTSTSSVAQLSAFSFNAQDSMPGLAKAVFTIEERIDTGLVYNKDSIQYGTSLKRVVPKFTFQVAVGSARLQTPDTTILLSGRDTIDFSRLPIYLTLRSSDGTTTKVYEIRPTVHQADPDLYHWTKLQDAIYPTDESEQRVVELNDLFVMIANNGFENKVYTSSDGASWNDLGQPSGLPTACHVRQIISDGTKLYYAEDGAIYTSDDAIHWTETASSYSIKTMLMYWNDRVWALVDNNGWELAMCNRNTYELTLTGLRPDSRFPVSDFAAIAFQSASHRSRAMIIGGFAEDGRSLNTRWNIEYSDHIHTHDGYRLEEFSIDRPQFTSLTGISVIWYNHQLMMFGGVDNDMQYLGRDILLSTDEGINWVKADTAKNQLPEAYQARQKQTAIVRGSYIYLFGGQDHSSTYSDVYRGKLNSIDW